MTVQKPCFDQDLETCGNFGILVKIFQCNESINEATFEWQAIKDILQNEFLLEFFSKKTINLFHLLKFQLN